MSSNTSRGPDTTVKGAVYIGQNGCEHQEFMQPIEIVHGTGRDEGTVTLFIGTAAVSINCKSALIALLDQRKGRSTVAIAG